MENITTWRTKIVKQGLSNYILIPKKMLDFEGIGENDIIKVTIEKQPVDDEK